MRLRVVATRITHPFSVTRTGAILLSQERNNSAVQTEDTLPPDTRRHPGATPTRSSFTPQWTLRHDNLALWGRKHWVKILQFSITNRLYTHIWKCHMGFCTPRRTVIDQKKKKKSLGMFYTQDPRGIYRSLQILQPQCSQLSRLRTRTLSVLRMTVMVYVHSLVGLYQ